MPTNRVIQFSEYIALNFIKAGKGISNLQLQKILYYVQAWSLVHLRHHMFDEQAEAWVNGPVYPSVYRTYRKYGPSDIALKDIEDDKWEEKAEEIWEGLGLGQSEKSLIEAVIGAYGNKSPFELVYLTHSEDPWVEARAGLSPVESSNNPISYEAMDRFYRARSERQRAAA